MSHILAPSVWESPAEDMNDGIEILPLHVRSLVAKNCRLDETMYGKERTFRILIDKSCFEQMLLCIP